MEAQAFTILERQQKRSSPVADISDFSLVESEYVAAEVVLRANMSLYCLDPI